MRIVVCMEDGEISDIYTDGKAADIEVYTHDVDRGDELDVNVTRREVVELDADGLAPYLRPHGIMVKELIRQARVGMEDTNELVVGVDERVMTTQGLNCVATHYYPVTALNDGPLHPFCILTIDQSRAIDICEEDLR
jgi:hypothetical protein